jgi:hypothetical protein
VATPTFGARVLYLTIVHALGARPRAQKAELRNTNVADASSSSSMRPAYWRRINSRSSLPSPERALLRNQPVKRTGRHRDPRLRWYGIGGLIALRDVLILARCVVGFAPSRCVCRSTAPNAA